MEKRKAKNLFEHLLLQTRGGWANQYGGTTVGDDVEDCRGDWEPHAPAKRATNAAPGSVDKVRELRKRLETGREMWHQDDAHCFRD